MDSTSDSRSSERGHGSDRKREYDGMGGHGSSKRQRRRHGHGHSRESRESRDSSSATATAVAVAAAAAASGDDSNIDAELLGANEDRADDNGQDGEYQDAQAEHDAHVADAAAAVSATYDELVQHNQRHAEEDEEDESQDIGVSLNENATKKALSVKGEHEAGAGHEVEDDVDKKLAEADAEGDDSLNDIDEARKRLARRGRKAAPVTGTDEWKQQRRDSHKEVERRRRESINQAISSLSLLLPVKETSKAAILSRAAEYIEKLKETENANIEKWTLQKLLSEQSASQLETANAKLQEELGNAFKELDNAKRLLAKHGLSLPDSASGDAEGSDANAKK